MYDVRSYLQLSIKIETEAQSFAQIIRSHVISLVTV